MSDIPTLTVMKHSEAAHIVPKKRSVENLSDPLERIHDTHIIDDEAPVRAAQTLMLDLGVNRSSAQLKRILIVSSPFRSCVETAVIVAQCFGVEGIYVHYGLAQSMPKSLDSGWDWASMTLLLSPREMEAAVYAKASLGIRKGYGPVRIAAYVGDPLSSAHVNETDREYNERVRVAIEESRVALQNPGDHAIIIGHDETLRILGRDFGGNVEIFDSHYCCFMTLAVPSDKSMWIASRSRVQMSPK